MSRVRKLSEGTDLPLARIKHRQSSKSINTSIKRANHSPYSKIKLISRNPSYLFPQHVSQVSKQNLSIRSKSKNSFHLDESSLSAARVTTPWDNLIAQASKIKEKLKQLDKKEISSQNSSKIFEIFEEIIEKDLIFGKVLENIKECFQKCLKSYEESMGSLNKQIEILNEEKQSFSRMLDRLSTENIDLGKEISRLQGVCSELQETLDDIRKIDLGEIPNQEEKLKAIIYENQKYSCLVNDMKHDLQEYQYKEDQLIRLIGAIKLRGIPVDDIYEEDVNTSKSFSQASESMENSVKNKIPSLDFSRILGSSQDFLK